MNRDNLKKIELYLRNKFKNKFIKVEGRQNKSDSADVIIDGEFIGVIFEDNEDGETCYHFNMTIIKEDILI